MAFFHTDISDVRSRDQVSSRDGFRGLGLEGLGLGLGLGLECSGLGLEQ